MIQKQFPIAVTLVLLAACQSDRENTAQSSNAPAAQDKAAHSVPAAPLVPAPTTDKLDSATVHVTSGPAVATTPVEPDMSPAGRLATVKQEYEDANEAYFALFKGAKTDADYEAIDKTAKRPDVDAFRARARAIVDEDPTSPVALDGITWMLTNARGGNDQAELLAIVEKNHMQSDKLVPLTSALASDTKSGGQALVQKLLETSPSADVRGNACYALAGAKARDLDSARKVQAAKTDEEQAKLSKRFGPRMESLKAVDIPTEQKKVEAMLERTVKEFPDVVSGKSTLGVRAGADLFEMNNLVVGKVAPDIAGEDLDGANFRLADYRGKIVLLDFWGNW